MSENNGMKKIKNLKVNTLTKSEIEEIVTNDVYKKEICGDKVGRVRYRVNTIGKINRNGRSYCDNGISAGVTYWHTHTYNNPFWPSLEDIKRCSNYKTIEMIFSSMGIWKIKFDSSKLRSSIPVQTKDIDDCWKIFHNKLDKMFCGGTFEPQELFNVIYDFKKQIRKMGYRLTFEPFGNLKEFKTSFNKLWK